MFYTTKKALKYQEQAMWGLLFDAKRVCAQQEKSKIKPVNIQIVKQGLAHISGS
jgi:hypothetical protein